MPVAALPARRRGGPQPGAAVFQRTTGSADDPRLRVDPGAGTGQSARRRHPRRARRLLHRTRAGRIDQPAAAARHVGDAREDQKAPALNLLRRLYGLWTESRGPPYVANTLARLVTAHRVDCSPRPMGA